MVRQCLSAEERRGCAPPFGRCSEDGQRKKVRDERAISWLQPEHTFVLTAENV